MENFYLLNKKILVTGGKGFLGKHLVKALQKEECKNVYIPDFMEYDLRKARVIRSLLKETRPDIIIHLAANVGGIGYNKNNPADIFYDNALMGIQLIHEAYKFKVEKFVAIGTVCAYPKFADTPFKEETLWDGYPEETNAPYGIAKKMMLVQSQAYRDQYGFNSIFLLPANLYGIGDNFNFESSHVIPALIRKFALAKWLQEKDFDRIRKNLKIPLSTKEDILIELYSIGVMDINNTITVKVWGNGHASREFLYVKDAVDGILKATKFYNKPDPINIGNGNDISISSLVSSLKELTGFKGNIMWEMNNMNGQPRRRLDTNKAFQEFFFRAETSLGDGLKKTVDWYLDEM